MYNLKDLTEFNPALVYAFDPEASPKQLAGSTSFLEILIPVAGQHEDVLNAYLYAQNTILPIVKEKGFTQVGEDVFLEWINTLHTLIGRALFESHGLVSGKYSHRVVTRWHKGAELYDEFILYLSSLHECKNDNDFIVYLQDENGLVKEEALDFILLLRKLQSNKKIKPRANEQQYIKNSKKEYQNALTTLHKLIAAYHTGQFTTEEKASVDKIVKICMYPELIPEQMQAFTKKTLEKYASCDDPKNLDQISQFLAETFYDFTEIHPYPNANGRTAVCIINILLRSFNLPSILLRYPGEKESEDSAYTKAIAQMEHTLVPLQELIKMRIQEAQVNPFNDEVLAKAIELRVGFSQLITRIHQKYPKFDLDSLNEDLPIEDEYYSMDPNHQTIYAVSLLINKAIKIEKNLDDQKQKYMNMFSFSNPVDNKAIDLIKNILEQLSGVKGWRINQKNGLVGWIEIPAMDNAIRIQKKLEQLGLMDVSLSKRIDNGTPVIKCSNIHSSKLSDLFMTIESLSLSVYNVSI